MPDDSQDVAKESPDAQPALLPLPELPMRRETYCSQKMADYAIGVLWKKSAETLREMIGEESSARYYEYRNACWGVIEFLRYTGLYEGPLPDGHLGMLDLMCELSRRIRMAYAMTELLPAGKPLADGPYGSFPPLMRLETRDAVQSASGGNITQHIADQALLFSYERRMDLWFAVAEEHRNQMFVGAADEFRGVLRRIVEDKFPDANLPERASRLYMEGLRRLYRMCELEDS